MGWRDRDWARFTDEERRQFYGGGPSSPLPSRPSPASPRTSLRPIVHSPAGRGSSTPSLRFVVWSAVGVAAILVGALAYAARSRLDSRAVHPSPATGVVYSGPIGYWRSNPHQQLACTGESANTRLRVWVCTSWQNLQPGQVTRPAVDPGGPCGVRHVDQTTGEWVCDSIMPPDPDSLPHVGQTPSLPLLTQPPIRT